MLRLILFLLISFFAPGLQNEEVNTAVVDKVIEYFNAMAKPSDHYLDRLELIQKTIPSFLNLSENFGEILFAPEYSTNSDIPDYLTRDMMDVESTTKLYNYFKDQYGLKKLTEIHKMTPSSSYVLAFVLSGSTEVKYSLVLNVSMILSDYFKYGFMGFLAPNVSPAHLTEYMKDIYRWCRNETVGIEPIAKEMNKWLVKSCSRNSSLLWQKINTFLGTVRDDYHWFNPANIFDRNTPTALRFRAHMLSFDNIDEAIEIVEKMEKKLLSKDYYKTTLAEISLLFEEAFKISTNGTACLLDTIAWYDRKEMAAFMNDIRFEMSRMLASALLCAAPNPKSEKKTLETIGSLISETVLFLKEYIPEKLKSTIYVEERIAKRILMENKRKHWWFDEFYVQDKDKLLAQWNYSLSHIGNENIRRQFLVRQKEFTDKATEFDYTCRSGCINFRIYGINAIITRYVETNETAVEEFTKQAKACYRRILPILTSSNEKRNTLPKIIEEIERQNISLVESHIGSTVIIRHLQTEWEPCNFKTSLLFPNRGEDKLPAVISYKTRHRVIKWLLDDDYACTEVYFFM